MAAYAYFADLEDGSIHEWRDTIEPTGGADLFGNPTYRAKPARIDYRDRGARYGWSGERNAWLRITRAVAIRANPSRHICDIRCINARGRAMECECACGGKNHGRGAFLRCT